MLLEKYESYKDSGVEWLGEIPRGWVIQRLKYITDKIGDGIHSTPVYIDDSEYFFINGNNLKNNKVVLSRNTSCVSIQEYKKYKLDLNNKTILMSINGTIGSLAFYAGEKIMLGKRAAYINFKQKKSRYYFYYLLG